MPGGSPLLLIFRSCPQLIENLPQLQISEKNPNDCAETPHAITHICDALRYFAAHRTLAPEPGPRAPAWEPAAFGDGTGGFDEFMTGGEIGRPTSSIDETRSTVSHRTEPPAVFGCSIDLHPL